MAKRWIIVCFSLLAFGGCAVNPPRALQGLDANTSQAIVVHPIKQNSIQANLSAWQRHGQRWDRVYFAGAVIGRKGLALPSAKKEGDGKTPFGTYPLGPAFGYASSIDTGLDYRQARSDDFWVDDPRSMQYNQWISGKPDAGSYERMRRADGLYQYGIVIGYNTHPIVPGAGSAIFLHVWRRYNSPTAGCVAVNQRSLRKILRWLNRQYQPVIILE
jgi:L,D-peptidoglycan transpeptidase YkuD (ErfK/YbiS/YcfS/YnhG family)